jgi:hypothetical protein
LGKKHRRQAAAAVVIHASPVLRIAFLRFSSSRRKIWSPKCSARRAALARLYNRNPGDIIVVNHDTALAIK